MNTRPCWALSCPLSRCWVVLATLLCFLFPLVARAQQPAPDTWQEAKARGTLLWGADQEGGAPYIFPSEENADVMIGFEVDMAVKMSEYLGMKVEFQQSQWDALPSMLQAKKVDIVMNGYEWMPDRAQDMGVTIPYYVYALQLLVHQKGPIQGWDDLQKPKADGSKWRAGVLSGSAAEEYLSTFEHVDLASYDGVTDSMREVETGKLDLTLQDTPIASFYAKDFPQIRFAGDPVSPGYYVIYVRKGDNALLQKLNEAIIVMFRSGDLERIYTRYGMWNKDQEILKQIVENGKFYGYNAILEAQTEEKVGASVTAEEVKEEEEGSRIDKIKEYAGYLVTAAGMTVLLSAISFPLAIIIGMAIAVGRLYGPVWIQVPLAAYVEGLRGTPLMLQLYFIFYFLPELGIAIPAFTTAIIGLAVNYSAYESEIYRAGLQAIPPGQMEAALSLGMSRGQALRRIVVPQAFRIVIPPVVNDFIAMFKDTSVCSVVTIVELTKRFSILSRNNVQSLVELMVLTGILYMLMSYPMSLLARRLEKTLARESA